MIKLSALEWLKDLQQIYEFTKCFSRLELSFKIYITVYIVIFNENMPTLFLQYIYAFIQSKHI